MMSTSSTQYAFRGLVESLDTGTIVIGVSGSSYRLRLAVDEPVDVSVGERVMGAINACGLRVHVATAGGLFIEPISGEPRIVAGRVESIDRDAGAIVVQSVVPMCVQLETPEEAASLQEGDLVNFHVRSGAMWQAS
jgi:hypothetical protein